MDAQGNRASMILHDTSIQYHFFNAIYNNGRVIFSGNDAWQETFKEEV
jgi:hypothetical protein